MGTNEETITVAAGTRVMDKETGDTYRVQMVADDGTFKLYGEQGWFDPKDFSLAPENGFKSQLLRSSIPLPHEQPEAKCVIITIDHLVREDHPRGEVVIPFLFSTVTAQEALLNQVPYFVRVDGAANILMDPSQIGAIAAGLSKNAFYVYTPTARLTNLIMDEAVWARFVDIGGGTVLGGATAAIQEADVMTENFGRSGRDTTLMVFIPDDAWFQDEVFTSASAAE